MPDSNSDIVLDYSFALADSIGDEKGITEKELASAATEAAKADKELRRLISSGEIGFFDLPSQIDSKPFIKYGAKVRDSWQNLVVLGIGGSALGITAIHNAINGSQYNLKRKRQRGGYPRLFVADNIDPVWFNEILKTADPKKTLYNIISKSGSTAETMSQFMIVQAMLKERLKGKWKKRTIITTDKSNGVLREMVNEHGMDSFEIPQNIGGRFSVFSAVGLLPLACVGVDVNRLLAGANRMAERCKEKDFKKNPAYLYAMLNYLAYKNKGVNYSVMMPYANGLASVADWFAQLWGESLGKKKDGKGYGLSPIKALGATDQHSQVQLYVEGPADKMVTFVELAEFKNDCKIPDSFADKDSLSYLGGSSLGQLLKTEMQGTEYALATHGRPSMKISLPKLDEYCLGQLLFMMECSTAYTGLLMGINPFDQPGVEFGKQYTYAMMGRSGYEKLRKTIEQKESSNKKQI